MDGMSDSVQPRKRKLFSFRIIAGVAGMWLALGTVSLSGASGPTTPSPRKGELLDKVVAFVEGEAILGSEVEAIIALGLVSPLGDEPPGDLRRRVVDALIDDRLRARDLARFGEPEISPDEIQEEIDRAARRIGGRSKFEATAQSQGLDTHAIESLFRRQLAAIASADDRFGGAVFVTEEEIAEFIECDEVFRKRLADEGIDGTPKLTPKLSVDVRELLIRRRLGEQLDKWMAGLREKARIEYRDDREPAAANPH